jgi:CheY-like chemotaxis protein
MAKILVADDVKSVRDLIKQILKQDGHQVIEAETGKRTLETLNTQKDIEIVFLDIGFPDMSGTTVMEAIAKDDDIKAKVCFVSGEKTRVLL